MSQSATTTPFPRLLAVDLSTLPEAEMTALRMECIRLNCSFEELLSSIVRETAERLTATDQL